jgi:hypothetical protein
MFANIQNYQKLQIVSAFLHIYKFAHAKFACFHTCYEPMTKFPSLQNKKMYRLQINNYNFTISQIANACLQVLKFASLHVSKFSNLKKLIINNYNFTISQIASACLQVHKFAKLKKLKITIFNLTNCKCMFTSMQVYKFAKLKQLQNKNQ